MLITDFDRLDSVNAPRAIVVVFWMRRLQHFLATALNFLLAEQKTGRGTALRYVSPRTGLHPSLLEVGIDRCLENLAAGGFGRHSQQTPQALVF